MTGLTSAHYIGAGLTLLLFALLGIYSGKNIKSADDFNTGGRNASPLLVCGGMIGTLVGGSSTIGTTQLAVTNGFSAGWFTFGASLGCLAMGLFFAKPLREKGCNTIQEIIRMEFGQTVGTVTTILNLFAIILTIVAQVMSANALLSTVFGIGPTLSAVVTVVVMTCTVVFGGVKSAGLLGTVKLILLYVAILVAGGIALKLGGGLQTFYAVLPHNTYFNLFSRGVGIDLGAGVSVLLGTLSTQTYMQTILSGKTTAHARRGAFYSALLIPPIGIFSIFVGMYMHVNAAGVAANRALPQFVIDQMPPLFGGLVLATLFIALVGTGSGMALGFATIITNDVYQRSVRPNATGRQCVMVSRCAIVFSLLLSAAFTCGNAKSAILTWSFLSMGFRTVAIFLPLCAALFLNGKIRKEYAIAASCAGLAAMLGGKWLALSFDTLFLGLLVGLLVMCAGLVAGKKPAGL